ncbi:DEAD/DEAH box helicase family protein [Pontibacter sp. BAB1700]|uniref:DEAD/DEAH box helicase family protein n=1 Tax=Pontibacter sp. BAB1700 TaxID=1144253 RepID=UPI00026BD643|nr:DEAD/DEAH box helicase family protein [Pontibacter sp. BAB1700]EJF09056.1 type III restriction protein res subunit [Pontibacter sp. BAB1700]
MKSNFTFLEASWPDLYQVAAEAESHIHSAPRYAALGCRIALENAVRWLFDNDSSLRLPYQDNLSSLLHEPTFKQQLPYTLFGGIKFIWKLGNAAAHQKRAITPGEAFDSLRNLYGFLVYLATAYSAERPAIPAFDENLLQRTHAKPDATLAEAKKLEAQYLAQQAELQRKDQELQQNQQLVAELQERLRQTEKIKQYNLQQPIEVKLPITEAETRRRYIDLLLREAGWDTAAANVCEYEVTGMPLSTNASGKGKADYVLWGDNGKPLAVVEAKKAMASVANGRRQAELYANCLEQMTGQRPVIFYTNGFETYLWDDVPAPGYTPRQVQGFYTKDELQRLVNRRAMRQPLTAGEVNKAIAGRYYQEAAIKRVGEHFMNKERGALLVMATGAGKTRTAAALVELLSKANWVTRALFLADRNALVRQAKNAFGEHVPYLSSVNLTKEKEKDASRMVFSTYPTMMNLIDGARTKEERFYSPGHFDLIIVDEAHRSIYQKYQAIFEYFDALVVGLTATPLAEIDRNTYELFGLESHQPTYAYELQDAVKDKYLVPPKAMSVELKFQRQGVKYSQLSEAEKAEYELTFRDEETGNLPDEIEAQALNKWLFNQDTVDKVLLYLMENGLKVQGGDKLGKSIIFARSHEHAVFIEKRFHKLFPQLGGGFLRIIDNYDPKAQSLIDDFSETNKEPQVAVSVDMLDTGIDVPDIVNLVFFKPVRSSAKFWQMVGRGTRLRPDLFGPGQHKEFFYIFDFCENFEFFEAFPEGIKPTMQRSLSEQIFVVRLQLADQLRHESHQNEPEQQLRQSLLHTLHHTVATLDRDSFLVKRHLRYVEYFSQRSLWDGLSKADRQDIAQYLAPLAPVEGNDELARRFDLLLLNLMLVVLEKDTRLPGYINRVREMAGGLLRKEAIPGVKAQIVFIRAVQSAEFWQSVDLPLLEQVRQNLRDLVKFIDKDKQTIAYTNFEDDFSGDVAERAILEIGGSKLDSYHERVARYIRENAHHVTISRLRTNQPITQEELDELERLVFDGQERGTKEDLLQELAQRDEAPQPLGAFIRSIVGLDVNAAKEAFSEFMNGRHLSPDQIEFINRLINYLTANGTIDKSKLFEGPFAELNANGVDGVFREETQVVQLFGIIDQINGNAGVA